MIIDPTECPLCGSQQIEINVAHTIFCMGCHYCKSYKGNISRLPTHPLYEECGWKIKPKHPDANKLEQQQQ